MGKRKNLPYKIVALSNPCEDRDKEFYSMLKSIESLGVELSFVPTSGCYALWIRRKYDDRETQQAIYGPTNVKEYLEGVLR